MGNCRSVRFRFDLKVLFLLILTNMTIISVSFTFDNMRVGHSNCTLQPETEEMKHELEMKIDQGNRLIKMKIKVNWNSSMPNETYPNTTLWFMTTDATGKHLLSLNNNFEVMSLGTLSYGITNLRLSFVQEPEDCLGNLTATDADELLKFSLLNLPKTPKAVNEEEVNDLHICTGFAKSNGSCCSLSLTSGDITCEKLLDDVWMENYTWVIICLSLICVSQFIYFIPKWFYEEDKDHSYKLVDNELKLCVKVTAVEPVVDTNWVEVNKDSPIINAVFDKIDKKENAIFDLFIKSVQKIDTELVSEISNSCLLRSHCKRFVYNIIMSKLSKSQFWNVVFKLFLITFCASPVIVRTFLSSLIDSDDTWKSFLVPTFLTMHFFIICTFSSFPDNELIKKSLQSVHKNRNFEEKGQIAISCLREQIQKKCSWKTVFCLPLSFVHYLFWAANVFLFPFLLFNEAFLNESWKRGQNKAKHFLCVFLLSIVCLINSLFVLFFYSVCAIFYIESIYYILIGVFLNYEQVFETVLFILMVLTYTYDCLHNVNKRINSFNETVLKLMFEFSDKPREQLFVEALAQKDNTVTAMTFNLDDEERKEQSIKLDTGVDGKLFLSVGGLYIFYKFENSENMPYLNIPQSFYNDLASKPGHFTPGRKHIFFLKACREIGVLTIVIFILFLTLRHFANVNNLSEIVHIIVTVASSVALAMLNRLFFRSFKKSSIAQDLHLKQQIKRHLKIVKDIWCDVEFDCSDSLGDEQQNVLCDLLIITGNGESIESCYIQKNCTEIESSINMPL